MSAVCWSNIAHWCQRTLSLALMSRLAANIPWEPLPCLNSPRRCRLRQGDRSATGGDSCDQGHCHGWRPAQLLPFRYEDRLNPRGIAELRAGEMATVIGEVRNSGLFRTRKMPIFQLTVGQGRSKLKCLWFNATYLQDRFKPGQLLALYGKVEQDSRSGELQIIQPQVEMLGDAEGDGAEDKAATSLEVGRIVPTTSRPGRGTSRRAGFAESSARLWTI